MKHGAFANFICDIRMGICFVSAMVGMTNRNLASLLTYQPWIGHDTLTGYLADASKNCVRIRTSQIDLYLHG